MAFMEDPIRLLLIQSRPGTAELVRKYLNAGETEGEGGSRAGGLRASAS